MSVLVVGIGNPDRGDDAAGPRVSERLRGRVPPEVEVSSLRGDLLVLLDRWSGMDTVLLVDAMRSGAEPGTVRRIEIGSAAGDVEPLRATLASFASSHSVDVLQAVELGRALGRLPGRLVLYGIEGTCFDPGTDLSAPVARAVDGVVTRILEECPCTRPH